LHNFDLAGRGGTYRHMNDREDVVRRGLAFFDIKEQMPWDAVAIHGEDPIGLSQGSFESL
jgi:hypothetical protein